MYFLSIDGTALPTPSYYAVSNDDIDSTDSSRSDETGIMHRRRIREGVITCDVKWILNGAAAENLKINLAAPLLSVSLLDPGSAGYIQCDMFAKNLKSVFYQQQNGNENKSYWEISCKLIQY